MSDGSRRPRLTVLAEISAVLAVLLAVVAVVIAYLAYQHDREVTATGTPKASVSVTQSKPASTPSATERSPSKTAGPSAPTNDSAPVSFMAILLWVLAITLVIAGIYVILARRDLLWGIILIILGFLVGRNGAGPHGLKCTPTDRVPVDSRTRRRGWVW
ncbi:GPGG-motif small membrane protein [Nonomuraea sp. NPDC050451]|uniref:GPGG-motif small membrane protein n=1 Tax=Nonomuraea sp. NPDC050451 TaxID=3364364 RepID=UPI0037B6E819